MSRDIFVQDIPAGARSTADIPDTWQPGNLAFDRTSVIEAVVELAPSADFSDPGWGRVEFPNFDVEVNVGDSAPLDSFALHVRSADPAAPNKFIAALLDRLGVRAFDTDAESGIFGSA